MTSAVPLPDLRPIDMISALSQGHTFSLDVTRAATGSSAHADYVLSGVPALDFRRRSARLSLTGATANSTSSLYLYASVYANKARALRVRSTGAWVFRIAFPRTAVAGTTRTLRFDAKELQGYASVSVVYTYTAMPGKNAGGRQRRHGALRRWATKSTAFRARWRTCCPFSPPLPARMETCSSPPRCSATAACWCAFCPAAG
ncbi:MAG: hypothetical protein ACLUHE_09195 [Christensenellales bacterium]